MTERYEAAVAKVAAFLDRNYPSDYDCTDPKCCNNLNEAASIVDMVMEVATPTEYGVRWDGLTEPMGAVSLAAAASTALLLNEATSDGNLAYPVRRQVTEWEKVID